MKKIIYFIVICSLFSFKNVDTTVYVCDSKGATRYHYSETCRGLNACKHQIVKTTQSKSKDSGLTLCGWE